MTGVQLEKIVQTFGQRKVLAELDLCAPEGQYVVLLGPSGCGKTTTLRVIAGLQSPDSGEVRIGDKPVRRVAPRHRDVSMVFQHDSLYPHLTVGESIRFALRGQVSSSELRSRVDQAVGLTQTESILDRYPSRLSGGELRRAAVAKAIARQASVRLLDEPLALDPPVRHVLQDDILRWHTSVPGTSIHVTHDGQEAMRMADKIAVMDAGQIVQMAEPQEVFSRPQTVSVAQAVGSPPINLFRVRLDHGTIAANSDAVSCRLGLRLSGPDRDLLLGVRPDAFVIAADGKHEQESNGLVVSGKVTRVQSVQRDVHVHLTTEDDAVVAVVTGPAFDVEHPLDASMVLRANARDVHVFDADTGRRIEPDSGD